MKDKVKQSIGWTLLFIAAIIFLILAVTGRLGILVAIAFIPDNVAYLGTKDG